MVLFLVAVSFDIDMANQRFNTFFEEVKKNSLQLSDDADKKMRYYSMTCCLHCTIFFSFDQ
jgi:hypothetical protein